MKKIKNLLFILMLVLAPLGVLAADSISVSPLTINLDKGATGKFTVSIYNAAGKVTYTSNNTAVATVSSASKFYDTTDDDTGTTANTKTDTITITAVDVGSTTITVHTDNFGSYDNAIGKIDKTFTINVNVTQKSDVNTLSDLKVNGTTVSSVKQLKTNTDIDITLQDGTCVATIKDIKK